MEKTMPQLDTIHYQSKPSVGEMSFIFFVGDQLPHFYYRGVDSGGERYKRY